MAKPKPRPTTPKRMRLTERDKDVLQSIYDFEGLLSRDQLAKLHFGGSEEWAKKRLRILFENGYVRQPDEHDMHRIPYGRWIYWLDHLGLETVAGLRGEEPLYTDKVKTAAPQWAKVEHDLAVNDLRLLAHDAIAQSKDLQVSEWINEKTLTHWADEVTWEQPNGRKAKKRFAPDGFFTVVRTSEERKTTFAYLLELDMGTHSNPAFEHEKVRPGITYLTSAVYQTRFGVRYGRFLVVTTSELRLTNMLRQAARVEGGQVFYFTTRAAVTSETFFSSPIWRSAGNDKPFPLIAP